VLSGLKKHPVHLSAVVSMADDGGSSGILREEFGILPTGDVRRALIALSSHQDKFLVKLFAYRFKEGGVNGHNFGNLILTALERVTGNFEDAVEKASHLLDIKNGAVLPVTLSDVRLFAELEDGNIIYGESNIDIPKHDGSLGIKKVWLHPRARTNPKAVKAIMEADAVILGPGDIYTSLIPNFLVGGINKAIQKTKAKKIYVMNLMTKFGETHGFVAEDFLNVVESYLKKGVIDIMIMNSDMPDKNILKRYRNEKAFLVDEVFSNPEQVKPKVVRASLLRRGAFVRHDPDKLASVIIRLI